MSNQPADTATIRFVYDDAYENFVREDENSGMWITTQIEIGSEPLWNFEYDVDGLATGIVGALFETVSGAVANERTYLTFEDGPSYLVVEPHSPTSVIVANCVKNTAIENPDERLDMVTELPVTKQAWAEAVVANAQEFTETVLDLNPAMSTHPTIQAIDKEIEDTKALIENQFETSG